MIIKSMYLLNFNNEVILKIAVGHDPRLLSK